MGFSQNLGWEMGIGSPLQGPLNVLSPIADHFATDGEELAIGGSVNEKCGIILRNDTRNECRMACECKFRDPNPNPEAQY